MATPDQLNAQWAENVQTWFYKNHLWGGVQLEQRGEKVAVIVTDYMDLTRTLTITFDSYTDALAAIGECIDNHLDDQRAALG